MGSIIQPHFGYDKPFLWNIWKKTCNFIGYFKDEDEILEKTFELFSEINETENKSFSGWEQIQRTLFAIDILGPQCKVSEMNIDLMIFSTFFAYVHFDEYDSNCFARASKDLLDISDIIDLMDSDAQRSVSLVSSLDLCSIYDQYKPEMYHVFHDANLIWLAYPNDAYKYLIKKQRMEFAGTDEEWVNYRDNFILNQMESDFIFHTDFCYHLYNEAAQHNLQEEFHNLNKEYV